MASKRHKKSISVSRETFERMSAYAAAHDTTIANVLCDACGIERQPRGRQPTRIEIPAWIYARLGKQPATRRNRFDRAIRRALDAVGA